MNYNDISNEIIHGKNLYNIKLRVCYYARVSTDSDIQLNSLDNQLSYYEKYIKSNPNWTFVGGYVEEGVSGVRVDKRTSFQKMIRDAELNKFNLIITKEVSRFARDLEDSIHYIRKLKNANVGVFFENQNLNTFDPNSELILNIMFNLAQEESKKLSQRVKFGHRQAIEKGHVLGSSNITGYKKDNCKLVIVPEEAKFIRNLFSLYATGEYGFYKLSKLLGSMGYYNKNGKLYDKESLKRMIENPKYKGFYRAGEHEIIDYRTKKRKTNPKDKQIIKQSNEIIIPPIVTIELWDKANKILKNRTESYKNNNYYSGGVKYSFSSKIYCKYCNCSYHHSHGSKKKSSPIWTCGMYTKYGINECISPIISEKDLYNIFIRIMNQLILEKEKITINLIKIYKCINTIDEYENEIKLLTESISKIEIRKKKVLDLVTEGIISKKELKAQFNEYELELNKLNNQKQLLIKNKENVSNNNIINKISSLIVNELNGEVIDLFIRKFVDKIIVSKINDNRYDIKLDIFINVLGINKIKTKELCYHSELKDILFTKNEKIDTLDVKKNINTTNKYTYNVYLESL